MKGLQQIVSQSQLQKAYENLLSRRISSVDELAKWIQWCRLDPRLAEITVNYIFRNWLQIDPMALNRELKMQPWPSVAGPMLEQIREFHLLPKEQQTVFTSWFRCVMNGIQPVSPQLFFMGQRNFAGRAMRQDASLALSAYRQWGYLCREILINKAKLGERTLIPFDTRVAALKHLAKLKKRFTVSDYINHLGGLVTRRQAEHDLKACTWLKTSGQTKGRSYFR